MAVINPLDSGQIVRSVQEKNRMTPDEVLKEALGQLECVVVVGWVKDKEDEPVYIRSFSDADAFKANWLLDCGKHRLMTAGDK